MKYGIWRHFPEEARRRAAETTYTPRGYLGHLRTEHGQCPIGVALEAMGHNRWYDIDPMPPAVADALGLKHTHAAARFINAWDGGEINPADLPALLGIEAHS